MLLTLPDRALSWLEPITVPVMTTLARFLFAATLLVYYWNSAVLKLGEGFFGFLNPSAGAYIQIFPKTVEAVGYDFSKLGVFHWAFVTAGMWAEFLLPLLLLLGLFTRAAALGMIGFVALQSLTDLYGHGGIAHVETFGAWFDRFPDSVVLDQRAFWVFLLAYLVLRGGGPLALDRLILRGRRAEALQPA